MLKLNHVQKSFQKQLILKDISFTIKEGELVSLIGPSGSGKSTLISLIGGMLTPDVGDILLHGKSIVGKNGHISFMPQQDTLFPWRTILNNVMLGEELRGTKDVKRAEAMLERAGLGDVKNSYPHQLSGGMRQRASFIRALLSPQQLICLDEPFSALDEFTRIDMQKWLLNMWEEHKRSILFVTHNIEEALFLSDKIIILTDSPATVHDEVIVPFPRPRKEELLLTDEFLKWKRDVIQRMKI